MDALFNMLCYNFRNNDNILKILYILCKFNVTNCLTVKIYINTVERNLNGNNKYANNSLFYVHAHKSKKENNNEM